MNITIIFSIILIAFCFAAICVKIILKKDGQFAGTCASNNPLLNKKEERCSYCGADPGERCKKEEKPSEK